MAENAVGSLFKSLGSLLLQEGLLILSLHEEIIEIKLEFESMQSFLKDADMRQHTLEGLRTWVEQVRNMAYEVEDIIDEYAYFVAKHHRQGLLGAIYNTISLPKKIFYQYRMARKLKDIKARLKVIGENRIRYPLQSSEVTSNEARERLRMLGETSTYLPEDDLVGIERNRDSLISWLTNEKPERMVYAVVGMGGLGKTTLVGKAYWSSKVQNHFINCCAWVTVSQSFDPKKMLQIMIEKYMGSSKPANCDRMDYTQLVEILINHLQSERYVLILDDVWSIDAWNYINVAIPNNMKGSRIMITTRDKEVASYVAGLQSHVFHLQHLNKNEAWTLFCLKAFNNLDGTCPIELQSSALNIVRKCDGLPLAIATTGILMSSKQQDVAEWKYVEDCFGQMLSNHRFFDSVKQVLLLSYYELPTHLKQCFLHLCAFPEDCKFTDAILIRIWVAEGFVEKLEGRTLEDVAMDYIKELAGRCMIRYVGRNGALKYYRVHDVLREIGVSIAKDENFIINLNEEDEPQDNRNARRLLLQVYREGNQLQVGTSNLRSCIIFGFLTNTEIKSFNPTFKLLRVLDLQGAPLQEVPNSLGQLFNLQYLNLSDSKIRELPNSLKRLRNLRSLIIDYTQVKKLPSWIVKLKKMRHLQMGCTSGDGILGVEAPTGICMLKSLEALEFVEGNKELLKKIGNLTQLKWLGIESVNTEDGPDLCASLQRMKGLLELTLKTREEQGPIELEALSSPPPLLQVLRLNGKLERLPHWIGSLENLLQLWLWNSNLSADPLSPLEVLHNLVVLSLRWIYDGNQLCFRAPFFSRLKTLYLGGFENLDMIEIEDGVMCHLQYMHLHSCQKLETLPVGIEYLRELKVLSFDDMPEEFTKRFGGDGTEEDRSKIQHIKFIRHIYDAESFFVHSGSVVY